MQVGERVTITTGGRVVESKITHADAEKSCGFIRLSPKITRSGHILSFKSGWFNDYWVVGLDDGSIIDVPA